MFELLFSIPSMTAFCLTNNRQGVLTFSWALHIAAASVIAGVALAVPMWFLVTAPRRGLTRQHHNSKRSTTSGTDFHEEP